MVCQRKLHLLILLSTLIFSFLCLEHTTKGHHHEEDDEDEEGDTELTDDELDSLGGNEKMNAEENQKLLDDEIKALLKDLGLENKESLTLENYKQLLNKFLTRDQPIPDEDKTIFEKIQEKMAKGVPETFPASDLGKYLEVQKISSIINELTGGPQIPMEGEEDEEDSESNIEGDDEDEDDDDAIEEAMMKEALQEEDGKGDENNERTEL